MDAEQLSAQIIEFLRSLYEDDWEIGVEALMCGIAEVESAANDYDEERVVELSQDLIKMVRFHRKASKSGGN